MKRRPATAEDIKRMSIVEQVFRLVDSVSPAEQEYLRDVVAALVTGMKAGVRFGEDA